MVKAIAIWNLFFFLLLYREKFNFDVTFTNIYYAKLDQLLLIFKSTESIMI